MEKPIKFSLFLSGNFLQDDDVIGLIGRKQKIFAPNKNWSFHTSFCIGTHLENILVFSPYFQINFFNLWLKKKWKFQFLHFNFPHWNLNSKIRLKVRGGKMQLRCFYNSNINISWEIVKLNFFLCRTLTVHCKKVSSVIAN